MNQRTDEWINKKNSLIETVETIILFYPHLKFLSEKASIKYLFAVFFV